MHNVWLIARREYLERIRAKSFIVMTILIPMLMTTLILGAALLSSRNGSMNHIAVVTTDPQFATDLGTELSTSAKARPSIDVHALTEPAILNQLDAQVKDKDGKLDGYLVVTPAAAGAARPTFKWEPKIKSDVIGRARIADAIRAALTRERLTHTGMSSTEVDAMFDPVELGAVAAGGPSANESAVAFGSAYGMFFLMYFVILFYGMNVARSIIEEKTSRVFEVLLATIRPEEMLAGKVIGVGAVGLTQVGIWIGVAVALIQFQLIGHDVHVLPTLTQTFFFIVFFLLGYLLYSSIAAALGAMTNSEQELQQMNIFLMLPLIACSVVIFSIVTNPESMTAKVFSFIPLCTPLIMYTRIVVGHPSLFAVTLSVVDLVAMIAAVLWVASRIYRVGILMYGKKPNLPEIMRWLKYS